MLRRQLIGLLAAAAALPAADKPSSPAAALRCRVTAWLGDPPLDPATVKATVEGRGAKIVGIHDPASPLLLLIVLDLTGDLALISPARDALKSELQALPANVWVALLRAQDGLRVLADPGPGAPPRSRNSMRWRPPAAPVCSRPSSPPRPSRSAFCAARRSAPPCCS